MLRRGKRGRIKEEGKREREDERERESEMEQQRVFGWIEKNIESDRPERKHG